MKTPSNQLVELISRLSKIEKKYFLRYTLRYTDEGEKHYLNVYKEIESVADKQPERALTLVDEYAAKHGIQSSLPRIKNYLYEQLLKCLRELAISDSIDRQVTAMIDEAEALLRKLLHGQAISRLKKAQKLAEQYELNWQQIRIEMLERKILNGSPKHELKLSIINSYERSAFRHMGAVQGLVESDIFFYQVHKMTIGDESVEKKVNELYEAVATTKLITGCYEEWYNWVATAANYKFRVAEYNESTILLEKLVLKFETAPEKLQKGHAVGYIGALNNLLNLYALSKRTDDFFNVLEKIKGLKTGTARQRRQALGAAFVAESDLYTKSGNVIDGMRRYKEVSAELPKLSTVIGPTNLQVFRYNYAVTHFISQEYKLALQIRNEMSQRIHVAFPAFKFVLKVFDCLIHYKLSNMTYLQYFISQTRRYMRNNHAHPFYLDCLKYLSRLEDSKQDKEVLQEWRDQCNTEGFSESHVGFVFDLISWLDSELGKGDFATVVYAKYNGA